MRASVGGLLLCQKLIDKDRTWPPDISEKPNHPKEISNSFETVSDHIGQLLIILILQKNQQHCCINPTLSKTLCGSWNHGSPLSRLWSRSFETQRNPTIRWKLKSIPEKTDPEKPCHCMSNNHERSCLSNVWNHLKSNPSKRPVQYPATKRSKFRKTARMVVLIPSVLAPTGHEIQFLDQKPGWNLNKSLIPEATPGFFWLPTCP